MSKAYNESSILDLQRDPVLSSGNLSMNQVSVLLDQIIRKSENLPDHIDVAREFGGLTCYSDEKGALNQALRNEIRNFIAGKETVESNDYSGPDLEIGGNRVLILLKVGGLVNLGQDNERPMDSLESTHYTVLNLEKTANGIEIRYADSLDKNDSNKDRIPETISKILAEYGINSYLVQKDFSSVKQRSDANCGYCAVYNALEMLGIKHSKPIEEFIAQQKEFLEAEFGKELENNIIKQDHQTIQDSEFLTVFKEKISEIDIRNITDIKAKIPDIIKIYNEEINIKIKEIITKLTAPDSLAESQKFNFAILGLGSLARGEMLPNSDFEFAILLDREFVLNSDADVYFTRLTNLLEEELLGKYQVILDKAGVHPNGDKAKNRLIGNIDQLSLFQDNNFHKIDEEIYQENPYLFTILGNPMLLHVSNNNMKGIYDQYISRIAGKIKGNDDKLQRIASSLRSSLEKHEPFNSRFGHEKDGIFNAKYEFGRIINLTLDHLDMYYCLSHDNDKPRTIENRTEKLSSQAESTLIKNQYDRIISSYKTAIYLRSVSEIIDLKSLSLDGAGQYRAMSKLIDQLYTDLKDIYADAIFFTNNHAKDSGNKSSYLTGYHLKKNGNKEQALENFIQNTLTNPSHYKSHHRKAQLERSLGRKEDALATLQKANTYAQSNIDQIENLRKQAVIYQELGIEAEAKNKYFEVLEKLISQSQTYRAGLDNPKIFLIKTLIGLSELDLDEGDQIICRDYLLEIGKIAHFSKLVSKLENSINEISVATKTVLIRLSQEILNLIHDIDIKHRIEQKYLNRQKKQNIALKTIDNLESNQDFFIAREDEFELINQQLNSVNNINAVGDKERSHVASNRGVITPISSISGAGGIGKTTLAKEYAHSKRGYYRVIFCIGVDGKMNMDSASRINDGFRSLATLLNSNSKDLGILPICGVDSDYHNQSRIRKDVYNRLEEIEGKYLLIFDDVRDYQSISEFLPKVKSQFQENGSILITSRNSIEEEWREGNIAQITLNIFSLEKSMAYLIKGIAGREEFKNTMTINLSNLEEKIDDFLRIEEKKRAKVVFEEDKISEDKELERRLFVDAQSLARILHNYPLALSHAIAYMRKRPSLERDQKPAYTTIYEKYYDLFTRKKDIINNVMASGYDQTIKSTIFLSESFLSQDSKELLRMITMIDNKKLSKLIIKECLRYVRGKIDKNTLELDELDEIIEELESYSFIVKSHNFHNVYYDFESDSTSHDILEDVNYQMHDMVQETIANSLREEVFERHLEKQIGYKRLQIAVLTILNNLYNKEVAKHGVLDYFNNFLAVHLNKVLLGVNFEEIISSACYDENWSVLAESYANIGIAYYTQGIFKEASKQLKNAIQIREKEEKDSLELACLYERIGLNYLSQEKLEESIKQCAKSVKIREKLLPNSREVASSYNSLGLSYLTNNEFSKARELYQNAIRIQSIVCPNSIDIGSSYNELGLTHFYQNNKQEAEHYFSKGVAIREKECPDSIELSFSYINIGKVHHSMGQLEEAKELYEKALRIRNKILPDSIDVIKSYICIGLLLLHLSLEGSTLLDYQKELLEKVTKFKGDGNVVIRKVYNIELPKGIQEIIDEREQSLLIILPIHFSYFLLIELNNKEGNIEESEKILNKFEQCMESCINQFDSEDVSTEDYDLQEIGQKLLNLSKKNILDKKFTLEGCCNQVSDVTMLDESSPSPSTSPSSEQGENVLTSISSPSL